MDFIFKGIHTNKIFPRKTTYPCSHKKKSLCMFLSPFFFCFVFYFQNKFILDLIADNRPTDEDESESVFVGFFFRYDGLNINA